MHLFVQRGVRFPFFLRLWFHSFAIFRLKLVLFVRFNRGVVSCPLQSGNGPERQDLVSHFMAAAKCVQRRLVADFHPPILSCVHPHDRYAHYCDQFNLLHSFVWFVLEQAEWRGADGRVPPRSRHVSAQSSRGMFRLRKSPQ